MGEVDFYTSQKLGCCYNYCRFKFSKATQLITEITMQFRSVTKMPVEMEEPAGLKKKEQIRSMKIVKLSQNMKALFNHLVILIGV